MNTPLSLYFHIPFCVHRCAYCDFVTYAGKDALVPAYVDSLYREVELVANSAPEGIGVHTVFFGGGTPSLLTVNHYEKILGCIKKEFDIGLSPTPEISMEANPGTLSQDMLDELHTIGFNRISIGMQSADAKELHLLERIHDFSDVTQSVFWARQAGFENINLDLIYGLPGQHISTWKKTLKNAVGLAPEHLSLYSLTIEKGTPLDRWLAQGKIPSPDPDRAADMYQWASDFLGVQGYEHYEISNWAKPGFQCRHNLQYWRGKPYLGFGAGAHGYANNIRVANNKRIEGYINCFKTQDSFPFPVSPATTRKQPVLEKTAMQELMMTGLRLTLEGVSKSSFRNRFSCELTDVFGGDLDELVDLGLLEWVNWNGSPESIRLSVRGRLLGNIVFIRFVD